MSAPRFSWRGLTPQLFVIFILPLTALLLLVTFSGLSMHQQAMRRLVGERDERAVRAAANALNEQIHYRTTAIQNLALRAKPDATHQDLVAILSSVSFLNRDFDQGLAFYNRQGELLASHGDPYLWSNLKPFENLDFRLPLNPDDKSAIFASQESPQGELRLFAVAQVTASNIIAVGAFSPSIIIHRSVASVFTPGEEAVAFVVDADYRLLYQLGNLSEAENLRFHPGIEEALAGESGASYISDAGKELVIAYSPVTSLGWVLVIKETWEAVASPMLRTTENVPLVLIPVLVMAVIALWYGTRFIVQPLQELAAKAVQLTWGNFTAIEEPVGGVAEIRRLQAELVHLARKVKSAQQGLRSYISAITQGQEDERQRLARELHDDTLQALIALNQRIQLAILSLKRGTQASPASLAASDHVGKHPVNEAMLLAEFSEIQSLTEQTIQNLRRLSHGLRPIYLEDLGLVAALEMMTREANQTSDLNINFNLVGVERRLTPMVELALFRMAQEAINNVIRHAQASQAQLQVTFSPQEIILEISDDGHGFAVPESPAEFTPAGHYGLLGMHERAELIGARLDIKSSPNQDTKITIRLADNST